MREAAYPENPKKDHRSQKIGKNWKKLEKIGKSWKKLEKIRKNPRKKGSRKFSYI
jgi:hypothetical protein